MCAITSIEITIEVEILLTYYKNKFNMYENFIGGVIIYFSIFKNGIAICDSKLTT